ncbi:3-hydroxybutyrate dehydrogenase [Ewingella americana]|uniref:3-hydroxybutyrate dehydrogenase n=1 Tax=Ewingella americana TaxID=41202 RepID=A0A377TE72_9GAMM|nr:3-hydroxybutyrate dehydrogenase [Ewingella americana]
MKLDLTDKIAVVSGSTSGIGLGIGSGLAQAGATVVIVGRHQQGVDAAVATYYSPPTGCPLAKRGR